MLTGKWTYRSFRDTPTLVGDDPQAALALIFGEGVFDFEPGEEEDRFRGALGMPSGYALTLQGEILPGDRTAFSIIGLGVDQVPCLLGTVIRVNAHGPSSPAGYTASFIAVRHSDDPAPRTLRRSSLTRGI
jgi:hypothetical protein